MNTYARSQELNALAARIIREQHIDVLDPKQITPLIREIMRQANCSIATARCVVGRAARYKRQSTNRR